MDANVPYNLTVVTTGFNPRARDGREDDAFDLIEVVPVSIHAPVMDANRPDPDMHVGILVSIHAPVMDAKYARVIYFVLVCFNPRARDGRERVTKI